MISENDYAARQWTVIPSFVESAQLPASILDEIDNHPESAGKSSWGTRNILFAFILAMRPKVVLEIGGHIGSATVVMGAALKANGFGILYTLEPLEHYFKLLTYFVSKAGVDRYVEPRKMYSSDPEIKKIISERADMIFIDADHSYSHALHDIALADELLAENGLIFLDDVGPQMSRQLCTEGKGGVRQALLDYTHSHPNFKTMFLEPPFWLNPCGMAIVCKQNLP